MRNCPVCGSSNRVSNWQMDYVVPDGWELPKHTIICVCSCGMIYSDSNKNQSDYDKYYKERYDSELTLVSDVVHDRLDGLINFVQDTEERKEVRIVDFGGGEGYIERQLTKFGYKDVQTVNVGDELPKNIDLLIASHVLEHVYDLKSVMDKLTYNVRGKFIIDVPDAYPMVHINTLPILDYHQKHINHFTTRTLNHLMNNYGYSPLAMESYVTQPHNYPAIRVLYDMIDELDIYYKAKTWCQTNIDEKVEKLKQIKEKVVVWGCGDICLLLLDKVPFKVVHYVDLDPAYKNQTIRGIPVLDHVESDVPIVVIAQMQKESVLESIRKAGITNKVYVI